MHARVTTISGSPADADAGIDNFRANVVPFARQQGEEHRDQPPSGHSYS
jgi:hypothetical protein